MHILDMLSLRPVPAAGLFLALTRRCPLSCAHCSTNSMLSSEEHSADIFLRFVETFTPDNRPDLLLLTGGEPLLRPRLIQELTKRAHAVGTRVDLISGMFFARQPKVPPSIARAIEGVDHFAASLDVFHEQQVSRAAVFRVMRELVEGGKDVSFQVVGMNAEDPYLAEVTADIEQYFEGKVPALVTHVGPVGRARTWLKGWKEMMHLPGDPEPCEMAAWPVVTFDGTVVACCNQAVVDGPPPPHLRLGHATTEDWATIKERCVNSTMVRALRVFGPRYLVERHGSGKVGCDGYCSTCYKLSDDPQIAESLEPIMSRPTMSFVEQQIATAVQVHFPASRVVPGYADMLKLGYEQGKGEVRAWAV